MNTKGNQQFQRTDIAIQDVVMNLLEAKDIRKITVREICQAAAINRSTFYAHYQDVYELLERMNDRLTCEMYHYSVSIHEPGFDFYSNTYTFSFLDHIHKYQIFYRAWLRMFPEIKFTADGVDLLAYLFEKRTGKSRAHGELDRMYVQNFFTSGTTSVIRLWLERGCQEDVAAVREILMRVTKISKENVQL